MGDKILGKLSPGLRFGPRVTFFLGGGRDGGRFRRLERSPFFFNVIKITNSHRIVCKERLYSLRPGQNGKHLHLLLLLGGEVVTGHLGDIHKIHTHIENPGICSGCPLATTYCIQYRLRV